MKHHLGTSIAAVLVLCLYPVPTAAQEGQTSADRLEFAGLPVLNYDADEGVGYGALAEIYRHRDGLAPYVWSLQPTIEISTAGRRDISLYFDAPHLLPNRWRLETVVGSERHLATPYFGIGNASAYDPMVDAEDGDNPYFYRFGRTRERAAVTVQRPVGSPSFRLLLGAGVSHTRLDATPFDRGTTLLAQELAANGADLPGGFSNHVRIGLIHDTRDREVGTRRGTWAEALVQRIDRNLGSDFSYTRWTLTHRSYQPLLTERLVLANRFVLQGVDGDAPFYDLSIVQMSMKQQEGLGGAKTLRGWQKSRFVGKGIFLWNTELRWRASDFELRRTPFHVVLSGFIDHGRVWDDAIEFDQLATDLHPSFGGGLRLGMRDNFVVAADVGHSTESKSAVYIGMGYLY